MEIKARMPREGLNSSRLVKSSVSGTQDPDITSVFRIKWRQHGSEKRSTLTSIRRAKLRKKNARPHEQEKKTSLKSSYPYATRCRLTLFTFLNKLSSEISLRQAHPQLKAWNVCPFLVRAWTRAMCMPYLVSTLKNKCRYAPGPKDVRVKKQVPNIPSIVELGLQL
ncbi:hypothetical protein VTK56DRAFT_9401 [Thermocarpiscus australiensis]